MLNELQRLNFPTSAITDAVSDGTLESFIKDLGAAAEKGDETEHEFAEDEGRDNDGDGDDEEDDEEEDDGDEEEDHDDHSEFADEDDEGHHPQEDDEEDEPETADHALVAHGHDQEELDKLSDEEIKALYDHDIGSEAAQKNAEGSPPMDEQVQSGAGPGNEAQNHGGVADHSGLPDDPQTHEQGHDQNQPLVGGTLAPQQG
jgi:hypothetical protein